MQDAIYNIGKMKRSLMARSHSYIINYNGVSVIDCRATGFDNRTYVNVTKTAAATD